MNPFLSNFLILPQIPCCSKLKCSATRGYIERFFAVLKRYYPLNQLQGSGLWFAYHHAFEVCFAVLLIAWLAHHLSRSDLMHSRSRILAPADSYTKLSESIAK